MWNYVKWIEVNYFNNKLFFVVVVKAAIKLVIHSIFLFLDYHLLFPSKETGNSNNLLFLIGLLFQVISPSLMIWLSEESVSSR